MELKKTFTVTVDRKRYTLDAGTIAIIACRREHARGGTPRENALRLTGLRNEVADRLGIDKRTAYYVLAATKYSALFV